MGLLDDAIKEHLDLKRRRGADPTEIERLEREALGPVRRVAQESQAGEGVGIEEPEAQITGEPEEDFGAGADPSAEEFGHEDFAAEPGYGYSPERDDQYATEEPGYAEEPAPHAGLEPPLAEPPEGHDLVPPPEPSTGLSDPAAPAPAEPPPHEAEPPPHEGLGVETAEYDVEAAHAREDEGEDVLEETPEFLQDAPEHDRLWFEQRPPKDFDFDG